MSDKDHRTVYAPSYLPWIIWGLGAAFYFAGFYQRVAPAVMTDQLMADFGIGGAALGNLSAFYFYSYVAMLKLSAHWFPPRRFALVTGLGLCVGVAGAVSAGVPLRLLVDHFGWRPVMVISSAVTLALTLAIWFVVRIYDLHAYHHAFAPMVAWSILAFVLLAFTTETYCRQTVGDSV